jgi:Luciferase
MPVKDAMEKIKNSVSGWENIVSRRHRFGGIEFKLGRREIGHIHGNYLVDIPFTKKIKDEILSDGLANQHHILPGSGWISKYLETPEDVDIAIGLLKRSYKLALERQSRRIEKS